MLSRLLPKPSHFRLLTLISTKPPAQAPRFHLLPRFFSSSNNGSNNNKNGGSRDQPTSNVWKLSRESDENFDQLFTQEADNLDGIAEDDSAPANDDSWVRSEDGDQGAAGDIFARVEKEIRGNKDDDGANEWVAATKFEPWSLVEEEKSDLFNIQEDAVEIGKPRDEIKEVDSESSEDARKLEKEEQELTAILKGKFFSPLIGKSVFQVPQINEFAWVSNSVACMYCLRIQFRNMLVYSRSFDSMMVVLIESIHYSVLTRSFCVS